MVVTYAVSVYNHLLMFVNMIPAYSKVID